MNNTHHAISRCLKLIARISFTLTIILIGSVNAQTDPRLKIKPQVPDWVLNLEQRQNDIESKLDRVLTALENNDPGSPTTTCSIDDFINELCHEAPITPTVTYCFEQGHGVNAEMAYGIGLKTEATFGAGWEGGAKAELSVSAEVPVMPVITVPIAYPLPLFTPPLIGPPIPTEAKIGAGLELSRGNSTCFDVPIEFPTEANAQLRILLADIRQVYQLRAERLLNYASRATNRREFMLCAEESFEDMLTKQITGGDQTRVGFLKDETIASLLNCSEVPESLNAVLTNPNTVFDRLPVDQVTSMNEYQYLKVLEELDALENISSLDRVKGLPSAGRVREMACSALPNSVIGFRKWKSNNCAGGGGGTN